MDHPDRLAFESIQIVGRDRDCVLRLLGDVSAERRQELRLGEVGDGEERVRATLERAFDDRADRVEDGDLERLERTRQDVVAREGLVGVDSDSGSNSGSNLYGGLATYS